MERITKNNFVIRLLILVVTVTAVVLVTWEGVQQPYVYQEARKVHLAATEATLAAERADHALRTAADQLSELNRSFDAARSRLREVLQSYVVIQERLDLIDDRLHRMERVLGNDHE